MKKIFILLICILVLASCGKKTTKEPVKGEKPFVLEKADNAKDYVYLTKYKSVYVGSKLKDVNILTVNIKGDNIDNINMEIKNFVVNSVNNYDVYSGKLVIGNIIDYKYFINDDYISIIQSYFMAIDEFEGDINENVYVISLKNGNRVDNKYLLNKYGISEEEMYKKIEDKIDNKDVDYWISTIKRDGYHLYVNNENKLCLLFNINTDDELIKKELVFD